MCLLNMHHRTKVTTAILVLIIMLASTATAADNILDEFPFDPDFTCYPNFKFQFVDIDGDPNTGHLWEDEWVPGEVQVAINPINYGDFQLTTLEGWLHWSVLSWNCLLPGTDYCEAGGGKHAIRFIDVNAPGWIYNDMASWTEAAPKQVHGKILPGAIPCGSGYFRYYAYSEFEAGGNMYIWQYPSPGDPLDFFFYDFEEGISELVGVTYYRESSLTELHVSNSNALTYANLESEGDYLYDEHYNISFGYEILNPYGMRFKAVPYRNGSPCANVSFSTSPLYPFGSGTGSAWFSISERGGTEVDEIKLQVWNSDYSNMIYEESRDVNLYFHSEDTYISDVELSRGYVSLLQFRDSVFVCFCYRLPPAGLNAIVAIQPYFQGSTIPGLFGELMESYEQAYGCDCLLFGIEPPRDTRSVQQIDEIRIGLFNSALELQELRSISVKYTVSNYICGDFNGSENTDIDDIVYLIDYLFLGGPDPIPVDSGDIDCSGGADIDDVVYLINYLFQGGPLPCDSDGDGFADCM